MADIVGPSDLCVRLACERLALQTGKLCEVAAEAGCRKRSEVASDTTFALHCEGVSKFLAKYETFGSTLACTNGPSGALPTQAETFGMIESGTALIVELTNHQPLGLALELVNLNSFEQVLSCIRQDRL
jgi:hypothetical protein